MVCTCLWSLVLVLVLVLVLYLIIPQQIARWTPDSRHVMIVSEFNLRTTVYSLLSGGFFFFLNIIIVLFFLFYPFFKVQFFFLVPNIPPLDICLWKMILVMLLWKGYYDNYLKNNSVFFSSYSFYSLEKF